jgi:WD40 repeat protein
LGTIDIENVFHVYDVRNDYKLFKSRKFGSVFPVEIVSTFEENSWLCAVQIDITAINHDLSLQEFRYGVWDMVLPNNFSHQLKLQHPELSLFVKIKKIFKTWVSYDNIIFRCILIGGKNALFYSRKLEVMHVFSLEGLRNTEELGSDGRVIVSNIHMSANGDFVYLSDSVMARALTVWELHSNKKLKRPFSFPFGVLVVKDGVIIYGVLRVPELWNSDLTQLRASFGQLAGCKKCLSVSDELIACVDQYNVTFFNVFTEEIKSKTTLNEDIFFFLACSIKYHVLARTKPNYDLTLWKDGTKVGGWEDVLTYTSLGYVSLAEFSPQGNRLAFQSVEMNKIFLFDIASIKRVAQIPITNFARFKFFDNENLVCSSAVNHMLYFFNVDRGEILTCLDVDDVPTRINVCREQNIVLVGLNCSERFELIKIRWPRKL